MLLSLQYLCKATPLRFQLSHRHLSLSIDLYEVLEVLNGPYISFIVNHISYSGRHSMISSWITDFIMPRTLNYHLRYSQIIVQLEIILPGEK